MTRERYSSLRTRAQDCTAVSRPFNVIGVHCAIGVVYSAAVQITSAQSRRAKGNSMVDLDRRSFLLLGSASALVSVASQSRDQTPNALLTALPDAWKRAESLPLWPGSPPGGAGFAAQTLPADWPNVYVRNVAVPELHIFRPARSNGAGGLARSRQCASARCAARDAAHSIACAGIRYSGGHGRSGRILGRRPSGRDAGDRAQTPRLRAARRD